MDDKAKFKSAQARVAALKGFYIHLMAFTLVLPILFAVDYFGPAGWWVQWVFLGWGAGVLLHAFAIFGGSRSGSNPIADWEKRKIKEMMKEEE